MWSKSLFLDSLCDGANADYWIAGRFCRRSRMVRELHQHDDETTGGMQYESYGMGKAVLSPVGTQKVDVI